MNSDLPHATPTTALLRYFHGLRPRGGTPPVSLERHLRTAERAEVAGAADNCKTPDPGLRHSLGLGAQRARPVNAGRLT